MLAARELADVYLAVAAAAREPANRREGLEKALGCLLGCRRATDAGESPASAAAGDARQVREKLEERGRALREQLPPLLLKLTKAYAAEGHPAQSAKLRACKEMYRAALARAAKPDDWEATRALLQELWDAGEGPLGLV